MGATTVGTFGLSQYTGAAYVESVEITKKFNTSGKVVMNKDSTFGQAHAADPVFSFSINGRGELALVVGDSLGTILTAISGGVSIITQTSFSEKADDFPSWSVSGESYPSASLAT